MSRLRSHIFQPELSFFSLLVETAWPVQKVNMQASALTYAGGWHRPAADARSEEDSASTCAWHSAAPARRYVDAAAPPPIAPSRRSGAARHKPSTVDSLGSQSALEAVGRSVAALAVGALATAAAVGALEVRPSRQSGICDMV